MANFEAIRGVISGRVGFARVGRDAGALPLLVLLLLSAAEGENPGRDRDPPLSF